MAYGHLPFESDLQLERIGTDPVAWTPNNVYQLYQYIDSNPIKLPTPGTLSALGQQLLLRLLDANPATRITVPEIWAHPWLAAPPEKHAT